MILLWPRKRNKFLRKIKRAIAKNEWGELSLDHLHLEKVVLAGHSMGSYAALAFAQAYPQRLSSLALISSAPFADPHERHQNRWKGRAAWNCRSGGWLAATITHRSKFLEPLHRPMLQTAPNGAIGLLLGMAERPDLTELL